MIAAGCIRFLWLMMNGMWQIQLLTIFMGHTCFTAHDGETALEMMADRAFDVIISDIKMPGIDGPALYQKASETFLNRPGIRSIEKPFTSADLEQLLKTIVVG